jgi:poly-gamma-glutamate capsule biosynthesis protein CapA/YwtB (metallophosphatase superfamily)
VFGQSGSHWADPSRQQCAAYRKGERAARPVEAGLTAPERVQAAHAGMRPLWQTAATCLLLVVVIAGAAAGCSSAQDGRPAQSAGDASTSTRSPGPASPVPVPARAERPSFTVITSGDLLIHDGVRAQARSDAKAAGRSGHDFYPQLAGVEHLTRNADLAVCHLEVPLASPKGPFTGYPAFSAPPQLADALARIGVDVCSTASNHTLDKGTDGVRTTLSALDAAGIRHVGSARSASEAARPVLLKVRGVQVALLAYTYGFNGTPPSQDQRWRANKIDMRRILADAGRARAAGAEAVIVNLHWGDEGHHKTNVQQRELARRLLASPDIDLIVGQHAHVVQPIERVHGKWVVYGEGNLMASKEHNYADGATHEGIMPRLTFTRQADGRYAVTRVEVFPTLIDSTGPLRIRDASAVRADPHSPDRKRAEQAWQRTRKIVMSGGGGRDGLIVR